MLANAIYLDAKWQVQFDRTMTELRSFSLPDGTMVDVQTMQYEGSLSYGGGEGYVNVDLPYSEGDLSMMVVVPDDMGTFRSWSHA